jgi:hypothetical protein
MSDKVYKNPEQKKKMGAQKVTNETRLKKMVSFMLSIP